MSSNKIYLLDEVVLWSIIDILGSGSRKTPRRSAVGISNLHRIVNRNIQSWSIPSWLVPSVKGWNRLQMSLQRLTNAGLIHSPLGDPDTGRMPTDIGTDYIVQLGDSWREWPTEIRIVDGYPDYKTAKYQLEK